MKYLFKFFFIALILASCNNNKYQTTETVKYPYMRLWAVIACGNALDYNEKSPEEWEEKVIDSLHTWNFNIISIHREFIEQEPFTGCGNCLKTGDYLDVIVPDNQREKLKSRGFNE